MFFGIKNNPWVVVGFSKDHVLESWGSDITRIAFRITFFQRSFETDQFGVIDPATRGENTHTIPIKTETHNNSITLTDKENEILSVLKVHPEFSQALLAKELNWTVNTVKHYIRKLQSKHLIEHTGPAKSGRWIVK